MADLKTTQERRDRFRAWLHDDTRDHLSIRAWCVAEDACQDVDTLLAENARLRAAEAEVERLRGALRAMVDTYPTAALVTPSRFSNAVDAARAALGKP